MSFSAQEVKLELEPDEAVTVHGGIAVDKTD